MVVPSVAIFAWHSVSDKKIGTKYFCATRGAPDHARRATFSCGPQKSDMTVTKVRGRPKGCLNCPARQGRMHNSDSVGVFWRGGK
jgi:hypothetical protein